MMFQRVRAWIVGSRASASKRIKKAETADQRAARLALQERERIAALARNIGVPDAQVARGDLVEASVVDLSGELSGKRMSVYKVLLNRGGSAVDRWIANDVGQLFLEGEQRAIRYTQNLWARADGQLRAIDPSADVVDAPLGWSQHEALIELQKLKDRVPDRYWSVYENVCRFDEPAGTAGSRLASNNRSAIDIAKATVAFTAAMIAQWRRL